MGEASQCLSCPTAHWSTQDHDLYCTALDSQRTEWATLFSKSGGTNKFLFLLCENEVLVTMRTGLTGSFEVTLVTKLIKYFMPITHFNHGRWHLLPELRSIFTTALLIGHNPCKACFFLQPTQFKIQNISRMLDFNYLKKQSEHSPLCWFGIVQKPRAQKLQPDTGQLTPPFPSSSLPTLLSAHEWHSHLCCCHPQNNAREGCHCVFLWWQVWKVTVHEIQWEGIGEGTEEFFIYSYS